MAKSNPRNIGFNIDTSKPFEFGGFENTSKIDGLFTGNNIGGRLEYGGGVDVQFDLNTGKLTQVTVSALVVEVINEYHTTGIHSGKISKTKFGFNFGGSFAAFYGAEASVQMGFIIPNKEK